MSRALNLVAFQACWWAVILSTKADMEALGIAAVLLLNAPFFFVSKSPRALAIFVGAVTLIGFIIDSTMLATGVFRVAAGWQPIAWLCPAWLAALWLNFAMTFDFSLAWMKRHTVAAALFGAIGGPLSYWGGVKLGVLTFGESTATSLAIIALAWAMTIPALLWLRRKTEK